MSTFENTPDASGEYPYDAFEKFSEHELARAADLRATVPATRRGFSKVFDQCPHTPACPNVRVCIEEIAWYLRHRPELERTP